MKELAKWWPKTPSIKALLQTEQNWNPLRPEKQRAITPIKVRIRWGKRDMFYVKVKESVEDTDR